MGVDHYMSGTARPGISFHSLKGCVEDVNQTDEYLRTFLGIPENNIYQLTATPPVDGSDEPKEQRSKWPTYENIIGIFHQVTTRAQPGDLVYIHYSGHGTRVRTIFDDLKADFGIENDEALVPTDICRGGRYIRDVEIAYLLRQMKDKNLIVTVVFDCCHAGGATRNHNISSFRSNGKYDENRLDSDVSILSQKELLAVCNKSLQDTKRAVKVLDHWLLETSGYTFLAACRLHESAAESLFHGKVQGVLTYFLIETLKENPGPVRHHQLWDLVATKVRKHNRQQNVVMGGDGDRSFFTADPVESCLETSTIIVTEVLETENKVQLGAGRAQGISEGMGIDIWPKSCFNIKASERLVLLEVTQVEDVKSQAKVVRWYKALKSELEAGCQARPHTMSLQRHINLVYEVGETDLPTAKENRKALDKLRTCIDAIKSVSVSDTDEAFQVSVKDGHYIVLDHKSRPLIHPAGPVPINLEGAAEKLLHRMVHYSRYYSILKLENEAMNAEWISLSLSKKPKTFPTSPRLAQDPELNFPKGGSYQAADEDWLLLKVRNDYDKPLNITILDLDSSWSIDQIYPANRGSLFETLEPNQTLHLSLQIDESEGPISPGIVDTIKVIATLESTSFRWLELPSLEELDSGIIIRGSNTQPRNALEALQMDMMVGEQRNSRKLIPIIGWDVAQVTIEAKPKPSATSEAEPTQYEWLIDREC
ncbi:hypothetical protein TWF694_006089 [Orbilia ellipsospora]|uniref:Peptidase C14 caspase domain-containing protein n=1 Tax=Orbilia ellipsospora TaxID=2528407 RepID=A0AAV9WSK2_9PEZI